MDRNSLARVLLIAAILMGGYMFFFNKKPNAQAQGLPSEAYVDAPGFAPDTIDLTPGKPPPPPPPAPPETCKIRGNRFNAELSPHGAGLTHFVLTDRQYAGDMSTTPDIERWRNLRTEFRVHPGAPPTADDQVEYDRFDWGLQSLGGRGCAFTFEDDRVQITKTVRAGERPFELGVTTTLTNVSKGPKTHATTIETFAFR